MIVLSRFPRRRSSTSASDAGVELNRTKRIPTSVPTTQPQSRKVSCAPGPARPDGELQRNGDGAAGDRTHRPERVEQHRAAQAILRRAGSRPPPGKDKEHHLASRKCRRESTPQTTPNSARKFALPERVYDLRLRRLRPFRSANESGPIWSPAPCRRMRQRCSENR